MRGFSPLDDTRFAHPDPEMRLLALESLAPTSGEPINVLQELALRDHDVRVRAQATSLLIDVPALLDLLESSQSEVQNAAQKRLLWLVSRIHHPHIPEPSWRTQRLELAAKIMAAQGGLALALERDPELAALAVQHIKTQHALVAVAVDAPLPKIRLQAVARIHDVDALKRLLRDSRGRDKSVHRKARARLQEINDAWSDRKRVEASVEALVAALVAHSNSRDPVLYLQKLEHLEKTFRKGIGQLQEAEDRLESLQQINPDSRLDTWRTLFRNAAVKAHAAHQEMAAKADQEEDPGGRAEGPSAQSLPADLRALLAAIPEIGPAGVEDFASIKRHLTDLHLYQRHQRPVFRAPGVVPTGSGSPDKSNHNMHLAGAAAGRYLELCTDLEALAAACLAQADIDQPAGKGLRRIWRHKSRAEGLIQRIRQRLQRLSWPAGHSLAQLQTVSEQRLQGAEAFLAAVTERRAVLNARMRELFADMESCVEQGSLQAAEAAQSELRTLLDGFAEGDLAEERQLFATLSTNIKEYKDWQHYATAPKLKKLCTAMEALLDAPLSPLRILEEIHGLQMEWKQLQQPGASPPQKLLARFRKAGDLASQRCQRTFTANIDEQVKICQDLEHYVAATDWDNTDWREAETTCAAIWKRWKKCGDVPKAKAEDLWRRFKAAMDQLYVHLEKERNRNLRRKQGLLEKAKALSRGRQSLPERIATAKELQREWRLVGIATKEEKSLWREFHTLCDGIFKASNVKKEEQKQKTDALLAEANAIVGDLEGQLAAWAKLDSLSAAFQPGAFQAAERKLSGISELPKTDARRILSRVNAMRKRFDALSARARENELRSLSAVAIAVLRELNAAKPPPDPKKLVSGTVAAQDLDAAIRARGTRQEHKNTEEAWQRACVQLEIAANLETPQADESMRTELLTERLVQKFSGAEAPEETPRSLLTIALSPPILDPDRAIAYEARLEKALAIALQRCKRP